MKYVVDPMLIVRGCKEIIVHVISGEECNEFCIGVWCHLWSSLLPLFINFSVRDLAASGLKEAAMEMSRRQGYIVC